MQPCKVCGTPTAKPIGYCSQECDDSAGMAELFKIMGRFLLKEKQVDEMTMQERIYSDGINIGCSLHGWCGNTSHCPHCVPGDKARWTLVDERWKNFTRVLNVEIMPRVSGSVALKIDDKAEQERAEDFTFVQYVLTVLKRETQYGALVSVALAALDRIEKGGK